ncbi:MAG TPA: hypothetical protein VNV15_09640 [Opitutaceae bacterium]|jgi:hypothetical protein|nr:hypothetical protein [Opitutaceae bacterium]
MPACSTLACRFVRGLMATLLGLMALTIWAADDARFTDSLSSSEQTAVGLAKLSPAQRTALNTQIQRDVTLARQGNVPGFATTFTQRRTAAERTAAGLDLLSSDERKQLDALVARNIAQPATFASLAHYSRPGNEVEVTTYRPEIHGEMTVFAGAGSHGSSFYGGAITGIYDDPAHNFSAAATYVEIHGKGICVDPPFLAPCTTSNRPTFTTQTDFSAQMSFGHGPLWK